MRMSEQINTTTACSFCWFASVPKLRPLKVDQTKEGRNRKAEMAEEIERIIGTQNIRKKTTLYFIKLVPYDDDDDDDDEDDEENIRQCQNNAPDICTTLTNTRTHVYVREKKRRKKNTSTAAHRTIARWDITKRLDVFYLMRLARAV